MVSQNLTFGSKKTFLHW